MSAASCQWTLTAPAPPPLSHPPAGFTGLLAGIIDFQSELRGQPFQGYCTGDVEDAGAVAVRVVADSTTAPAQSSSDAGRMDDVQVRAGCVPGHHVGRK
jgi:hypothetical protein